MSKNFKKKAFHLLHHPINLSHASHIVALVTVFYMVVITLVAIGVFAGISIGLNQFNTSTSVVDSVKEAGNYVPDESLNTTNSEVLEIDTYPVDIVDYDFSIIDQQLDQNVNVEDLQHTIDQDLQEIDNLTYSSSNSAVLGESDYEDYDQYAEPPTYYYDESYNDYWDNETLPEQEYKNELHQPSDLKVYVAEPTNGFTKFVNSVNSVASSQNLFYMAFFVLLLGTTVYFVNLYTDRKDAQNKDSGNYS